LIIGFELVPTNFGKKKLLVDSPAGFGEWMNGCSKT
jgi:hypothetical protein